MSKGTPTERQIRNALKESGLEWEQVDAGIDHMKHHAFERGRKAGVDDQAHWDGNRHLSGRPNPNPYEGDE